MDDRHRGSRIGRSPGGGRIRDEKGRWVRSPDSRRAPCAAVEFVFDDRVLDGTAPPTSGEQPFRLQDEGESPRAAPATDVWNQVWPAEDEPAAGHRVNAGRLPSALWLLGAVLSVAGILLALAGPGVDVRGRLTRWLARTGSATASEPLQAGTDGAVASPDPRLDRVLIPAVPPPIAPRARQTSGAGERFARRTDALAETPQPAPEPVRPPRAAAGAPGIAKPAAAVPVPALASPDDEEENESFHLAEEYAQVGEGKRAEELLRRIHDHGRQRGRAALALGDLLAARGDFERASEFYRESTHLFQDGAEPLTAR